MWFPGYDLKWRELKKMGTPMLNPCPGDKTVLKHIFSL
jgi:hypothetical protein